jgi:ribulose-phosphate 3-epimerase
MIQEKPKLISPSILSADFGRLAEEIKDVEGAGCDWLHIDVMDGHFVPNLTIGPPVIKRIRKITELPFDVHLMIDEPIKSITEYADAGANLITVHIEACSDIKKTLNTIKKLNCSAGISIRPKTPIERVFPYLDLVDLVLVMTVEPGFGGQSFMPEMLAKVSLLKRKFTKYVSVDGGVDLETARQAARSGANVFVSGSAIFRQSDRKQFVAQLRQSIF